MAFERITIDPDRVGGVPCIRDLRVTMSMVLGQLAAGRAPEELLEDYPYLEAEDIRAALEYAAAVELCDQEKRWAESGQWGGCGPSVVRRREVK